MASVALTITLNLTLALTLSRVNLLVSFSAWAELVWRYLLEVTNTVNLSLIPGSTLKRVCSNPNPNPYPNPNDEAYTHFTKTNTDAERSAVLQPMTG